MEQVVSLYLRAKRQGGALPTKEELEAYVPPTASPTLEHSKSSIEFQKTLKNLRHELEQFDFAGNPLPQAPIQTPGPSSHAVHQASSPHHAPHPTTENTGATSNAAHLLAALRLDPRSRQIVHEIREGLNLSSEVEVIRMSLVLAHKNLKELLKKD